MQNYKINRTGDRPLSFSGEQIGCGTTKTISGPGQNRWTTVDLYLTVGQKYIAVVTNHTCWDGEHDYTAGWIADTADALLDYLKDEETGKFGRASQEALEDAVEISPGLAAAYSMNVP